MKIKTLLTAAALTIAPTLTLAMGCPSSKSQVMSCADGLVYDSATSSCIATVG